MKGNWSYLILFFGIEDKCLQEVKSPGALHNENFPIVEPSNKAAMASLVSRNARIARRERESIDLISYIALCETRERLDEIEYKGKVQKEEYKGG